MPRDPDLAAALIQMEEEENENNGDEDKPKVRFDWSIVCVCYKKLYAILLIRKRNQRKILLDSTPVLYN